MPPTIGMVYSRVRREEKMLVEAAERLGIPLALHYDEEVVLDLDRRPFEDADVVLERSISYYRGLYVLKFLEAHGVPAVNEHDVARVCGDKVETSLRLARAGVPTPSTRVAFTRPAAISALDELGYPAVLKPTMGSWARLMARVTDADHADAVLEHKEALPNPLQQVYYMQRYVEKSRNGSGHRDVRAFVVGDETVAAIWRESPHWITNTARGARATNCPVTDDLNDLCLRAANAVGGGVLAVDLMPTGDDGFTVHEVNHTMEFRNSVEPTGVDIPARILEYTAARAKR